MLTEELPSIACSITLTCGHEFNGKARFKSHQVEWGIAALCYWLKNRVELHACHLVTPEKPCGSMSYKEKSKRGAFSLPTETPVEFRFDFPEEPSRNKVVTVQYGSMEPTLKGLTI